MLLILLLILACVVTILATVAVVVFVVVSPFSATDKLQAGETCTFDTRPVKMQGVENVPSLPLLNSDKQAEMAELLRLGQGWLDGAKIPFWAVRSTLLAAVRHGNLMPWCDTVNLAIEHSNLTRLIGITETVGSNGRYILHPVPDGYRISMNNFLRFPYIQIDIMEIMDHEVVACTPLTLLGECTFTDSHNRRREIYDVDDVFPLREVAIGDVKIHIPQRPEKCLLSLYGPDALKRINHDSVPRLLWNQSSKNLLRRLVGRL